MLMINLENYKIEDIKDFKSVSFELFLLREMEFNLEDFNRALELQFEAISEEIKLKELKGAVSFIIFTDLGLKDLSLMQDFILNRFVSKITLDEVPFYREKRLGVPKELQNKVKMNVASLMDLINKFDNIKQINIGLTPRSRKTVHRIVEEE